MAPYIAITERGNLVSAGRVLSQGLQCASQSSDYMKASVKTVQISTDRPVHSALQAWPSYLQVTSRVKISRESSFQNDARPGEISDPIARHVSTVHACYMHMHWCRFSTDGQQNQTFNRPHVACNAERERDCRPTGLHK
ncbi:unnamed protein product [Ixodes pacificus]